MELALVGEISRDFKDFFFFFFVGGLNSVKHLGHSIAKSGISFEGDFSVKRVNHPAILI